MGSTIPYGQQTISAADIAAVVDVLQSDYLTQGPVVPAFEEAVAARCGARHAVAVNSATSALHIACKALGVGPGDRVWTSPLTFVASANAALYCGADVDFVDVDPRSYNMCPERLAEKLEDAAARAVLPKVIIPVHLAGQSCDMAAIHSAANRYGVQIIEDASHAIGGSYRDQPVGNCRFSDITVFSFHPVKIITTGEGGMALTNDDNLAELMRLDRSHGVTRDPMLMTATEAAPWYYEQQRLGFNYRLTDIAAALGLSQLSALPSFIARRRQIAAAYDEALSPLPVTIPWQHPAAQSSWHLYVVRLEPRRTPHTHREVFASLRAAGIGVNLHYIPVYLQPYYRALGFAPGLCPAAEAYYGEAISLPMFAGLTDAQQAEVVAAMAEALAA